MKIKDVYRYMGVLYGTNLITSGLTFLVMIWITRVVSKEALGTWALFQAYFFAGAYLTSFGLAHAITKAIAERRSDLREVHMLVASVLLGMLLLGGLAGAALIRLGYDIVGLAVLTLPGYQLFSFALAYTRGHLWQKTEAVILLIGSVATSVFIVLFLIPFPNAYGPIYGHITSVYVLAALLLLAFFLSKRTPYLGQFARVRGAWVKGFWRTAVPVFLAAALSSLGSFADVVIVEHFLGLAILAEFYLALTLFNILDKPVAFLARALLSHFCVQNAEGQPEAQHLDGLRKIVKINLLALPVFALAVVGLLPIVLPHFLNKDFSTAFDVLAVVSILMLVKSFEVVTSMLAIARNTAATNVYSQGGALGVYLPVALLLVHWGGVIGVAAAVALRWASYLALQFRHLGQRGVETVPIHLMVRALLAYLAALALFKDAPWAMVPVYLAAGFALRIWTVRDVQLVRPLLPGASVQK